MSLSVRTGSHRVEWMRGRAAVRYRPIRISRISPDCPLISPGCAVVAPRRPRARFDVLLRGSPLPTVDSARADAGPPIEAFSARPRSRMVDVERTDDPVLRLVPR